LKKRVGGKTERDTTSLSREKPGRANPGDKDGDPKQDYAFKFRKKTFIGGRRGPPV